MSKQFYTVKNYAASDLVGSISSLTGTDDEDVSWAFVKFADGATLPTWSGTPYQLTPEEAIVAAQSSLYTAPGQPGGEVYRQATIAFGVEVVESFVNQATGLPSVIADRALTLLNLSALAGIEGFVSLLRYQLATTPAQPDAGWTDARRLALIAQIDAFLCKFPGQSSPTPSGVNPQMSTITNANAGAVLAPGCRYIVGTATGAAFTVQLPAWRNQTRRTSEPVVVENLSGEDVTIEVNSGDTGVSFGIGGGSAVTLAGGERGSFMTGADGASLVWIERTL